VGTPVINRQELEALIAYLEKAASLGKGAYLTPQAANCLLDALERLGLEANQRELPTDDSNNPGKTGPGDS
jgi:hypothetical protein